MPILLQENEVGYSPNVIDRLKLIYRNYLLFIKFLEAFLKNKPKEQIEEALYQIRGGDCSANPYFLNCTVVYLAQIGKPVTALEVMNRALQICKRGLVPISDQCFLIHNTSLVCFQAGDTSKAI